MTTHINIEDILAEYEAICRRNEQLMVMLSPPMRNYNDIPVLYDKFKLMEKKGKGDVFLRREFIFIVCCLFFPSKFIGKSFPNGLRKVLNKTLGLEQNKSVCISIDCAYMLTYYKNYMAFRDDVKMFMEELQLASFCE